MFIRIGPLVHFERVDFLWCGWEACQIQKHSSRERGPVRLGIRLNLACTGSFQNVVIDLVLAPGVIGDNRNRRPVQRFERPVCFIVCTRSDPLMDEIDLILVKSVLAAVRGRHDIGWICTVDSLPDQRVLRLTGNDGLATSTHRRGEFKGVESKSRLSSRFIRSMTCEASIRENGANVLPVLHDRCIGGRGHLSDGHHQEYQAGRHVLMVPIPCVGPITGSMDRS